LPLDSHPHPHPHTDTHTRSFGLYILQIHSTYASRLKLAGVTPINFILQTYCQHSCHLDDTCEVIQAFIDQKLSSSQEIDSETSFIDEVSAFEDIWREVLSHLPNDLPSLRLVCKLFEKVTNNLCCTAYKKEGWEIASDNRKNVNWFMHYNIAQNWQRLQSKIIKKKWIKKIKKKPLHSVLMTDTYLVCAGPRDPTIILNNNSFPSEVGLAVSTSECFCLFGHQDSVHDLDFFGDVMVSCSSDQTIRSWDLNEKKEICVYSGHTGRVNSVQLFENGTKMISGSLSCEIIVWDLQAPTPLIRLHNAHDARINNVKFITHNNCISISDDGFAKIWRISDSEISPLCQFKPEDNLPVYSVCSNPNLKFFATGLTCGILKIFDSNSMKEICMLHKPHARLSGRTNDVYSITADNNFLFSGHADGVVQMWDLRKMDTRVVEWGHRSSVFSTRLNERGLLVVGCFDGTVAFYRNWG